MGLGEFGCDIWDHGTVKILELRGPLTLGNPALRGLVKGLAEHGETLLVLDLKAVTHLDSTGVGELVAACAAARRLGASVKLACLPPKIRSLLEMIRLAGHFDIFDSQESAVASFG